MISYRIPAKLFLLFSFFFNGLLFTDYLEGNQPNYSASSKKRAIHFNGSSFSMSSGEKLNSLNHQPKNEKPRSWNINFSLPQPAPDNILGTINYYRWRYNDFMRRHPNLHEPDPRNIPDYYLEYGEKYIIRFTFKLCPRLSDQGKEWLIRTRLNLQMAIENKCKSDPNGFGLLEENPEEFRKFAFGTHVSSYMEAGLSALPLSDLLRIGATPELKDLISKNGRSQVFAISKGLSKEYFKRLFKLTRHFHKLVGNAIKDGNTDQVEQAISFVEDLSPSDQKMVIEITRGFGDLRQAIKFRLSHKDGSVIWQKLLDRLERLNQR